MSSVTASWIQSTQYQMDDTESDSPLDEQLLARVAKGDLEAFGRLYDTSSCLLFTLALRILGQRDEAADILQDVYSEIWRKAARYDISRGTPMAWLVAMTRTRAIERARARAHRSGARPTVQDKNLVPIIDLVTGPTDHPAEVERRHRASRAYQGLPDESRQALEWAYFDGLTYLDIASRLNEPPGTIKQRIRAGMQQFRTGLQSTDDASPRYGT
ncbi:RNA polymerase [Nitrospira sp.]|nr:RNA polymerase [Nitrospira sp.]